MLFFSGENLALLGQRRGEFIFEISIFLVPEIQLIFSNLFGLGFANFFYMKKMK
jgi:hypothetical protein